jgi:hypothetical protein
MLSLPFDALNENNLIEFVAEEVRHRALHREQFLDEYLGLSSHRKVNVFGIGAGYRKTCSPSGGRSVKHGPILLHRRRAGIDLHFRL